MEILKAVSTWRVLDTIVWTVFKGELCLYVAYKLLLCSLDPLSTGEIWAIGVAYGCRCRPTLLRFLRGVFSYPDTPLRLSRRDAVQPWAMLLSCGYRIILGTQVFFLLLRWRAVSVSTAASGPRHWESCLRHPCNTRYLNHRCLSVPDQVTLGLRWVIWSFVGAQKGKPPLLSTSEQTPQHFPCC